DSFVQTRIFWPLGMMRSTTGSAIVEIRGNVASPHMRIDGVVTPVRRRNYDALGPAGSIFSSAHDMAQWIRLHLGNGVFEGRRMISDSVMAEMHRPQNPISIGGRTRRMFPDRTYFAYGLGWRLHDYAGRDVVQHTGTVNFMKTQIGMIPSEGIGVVDIGNLTTSSLQTALMYRIFDALLGRQARDWSKEYLATARYSSGSSPPPRTAGTRLSLPLQAYAGTYADSLYGDIRISFDDETDGLVLYYSPDYVADLEHWHNDTFLVRWRRTGFGTTLATFRVNSRGEILSMNLDGYSRFSRVVSEVMEPLAAP
ncbi:MAG: DUF3471 domain-containing protein, partial [Bacteroidota bacterium]